MCRILATQEARPDFHDGCYRVHGLYIAAAKQGIQRITERLAQAEGYDLRYGLVAYRDHPPQDSSFVTKVFPLRMS